MVHLTPRGHAALWYGLAILLVAATGFLLWHPQFRLAKAGVYHPFMPAVLLAACGGGLGPGLAATLLGAIVASGVLIPPLNQMGPETPGGLLNLLVFLGCGSATSFLCELFWEERMGGRETVLKLAQSEERCRRLLETTGEGVWILDPEGRLQFMNPRLVELLGHPVHELQGVHLLEFVPAEERAAADRFRQRIQDGEDFQAELPLRREDGKILQGQVHSAAIRDVSGRVLGSLGMVSDLSEAARLRTELRDASRRVVTILENVQDGFLSLDREYRVTYASPSAAALLGCTSSELRGVPVWESVPELVGSEVEAAIRGAGAAGPSGPLSFHHTGVERWIECRVVPFDEGLFLFATDRTAEQWPVVEQRVREAIRPILSDVPTLRVAGPRLLAALAEPLGWQGGCLWVVEPAERSLRCAEFWAVPGLAFPALQAFAREATLRAGLGLPGRAWNSEEPIWQDSALDETLQARHEACAMDGVFAACAAPIRRGNRVLGVLELFGTGPRQASAASMMLLQDIAAQIGHFLVRERAENDCHRTEARFRRLVRNAPVPIALGNAGEGIQDASEGFCRLVGVGRGEVRPDRTRWDALTPEGEPGLAEEARSLLNSGGSQSRDLRLRRADGAETPVRLQVTALDPDEESWAAFATDLSELRAVTEAIPEGWASFDASLVLQWRNAAFRGWFPDADGDLDTPWNPGREGDQARCLRDILVRALEGRELLVSDTLRHPTRGERVVRLRALPIQGPGSQVSGVLLRVEDRTEPSRAADLLTAAAEMERALGSQPDPAARLRDACRQVVPRVADWCVLTLLGAEGRPEQNLVFHANLARAEFLERFFQSYPILARDMTLRPRPFESGEPELCEEITEALGQVGIWDDSHLATLIRLGFSSSLCVPMRCGTQTLGALTLAMAESGRRIGLEDLPRAESLAARLAAHLKATLRSTENQVCG